MPIEANFIYFFLLISVSIWISINQTHRSLCIQPEPKRFGQKSIFFPRAFLLACALQLARIKGQLFQFETNLFKAEVACLDPLRVPSGVRVYQLAPVSYIVGVGQIRERKQTQKPYNI